MVDPIQWIYVLINGESSDYPTLMLLLCKDTLLFNCFIIITNLLFLDHIVPVTICLITEKALSVVSFILYIHGRYINRNNL